MVRFLAGCTVVLLIIMVVLLATNNAGNPAVLATVEYGLNTDAALLDRAAERAHNEEMARIAAQDAAARRFYTTLLVLGTFGILSTALLGGALVYGAAARPPALLERKHEPPIVIDTRQPHRLESRRQ